MKLTNHIETALECEQIAPEQLKPRVGAMREYLEKMNSGGRPKKWKTAKEKNAYFNAKRRKKKE